MFHSSGDCRAKTIGGWGRCASTAATRYSLLGTCVLNAMNQYAPYAVALVKLAEGPLVTAQLTDISPDEVEIGMPVEMVTRKIREFGEDGVIVYGYKFRKPLVRSA